MGLLLKYLLFNFFLKVCVGIRINNGGYEDVYIFIRDSVEEDDNLIKRIKEVFTAASEFMLTATENRMYFKHIRIVVPKTWSEKPEYLHIPAPSLSKQYIIVDGKSSGISTPHVRSTGNCGAEGFYMFLSSTDFILQEGDTRWGSHDHVIVHEWGHLRWGVFDEYPISTKFYQEGGKWIPVRCTTQINGKIGIGGRCTSDDSKCDISNTGKKMSKRCNFCPEESTEKSSSLMGYSFLDSITQFCDKDESTVNRAQRHNKHAPNRHNILCKYQSVWEVMRRHSDFKDNFTLPSGTDTVPDFEIIQSSDEIYRVFVLDVSGSMSGEKLLTLQQTCKYVIQDLIPQYSWLGIVTFSSSVLTTKHVTKINTQSDRDELKSALPTLATGATCIGCGIEEAIRILKRKSGKAENTEIVLISDGLNNRGNISFSIQYAVSEKVIVNTIAVSQEADSILADIAEKTGGKHYTYLQKGTISFAATFRESIKGDLTSSRSHPETLVSEKIDSTESRTVKFNFTIEESIGANTTITVISRSYQELHLELSGPNRFTKSLSDNGTQVNMLIDGIAEAGLYQLTVTMTNDSQTIEYYVSSTPSRSDVVKITSQLSASKIDVSSGVLPVAFASITKGYSIMINVSVKAHVESSEKRCTLTLLDNGHDPDAFVDDGIYSGYVFPHCLDSGRVNIKVYASGQKGLTKISRKVTGAPSLIEENDEPEVFNEAFQRVQVMEELYVTKVSNNVDTADVVSPGRITDVGIYHIVKETTANGENRNFTISWTATGDDRNQGRASYYIMRTSDDFEALLNNFDSASLLNMTNTSLIPQEAGQIEALKFIVDAEQSYVETTFFAVQAVDDVGNRGAVSNIVSIVVAKGYRSRAEPGTTLVEREEMAVAKGRSNIAGIIWGTVGGLFGSVIICCLIVLLRRYLQRKTHKQGIP